MGRGQMRNLETFGVGTGEINEFEYQKNQGELTEQLEHQEGQQDAASGPPATADRVKQIMAEAHEKVEERKRKGITKPTKKKATTTKSAAKKPATRGLAGKTSTARKSAKKSPKKSAARKSTKKSAKKGTKARAKKPAAKKSSRKR